MGDIYVKKITNGGSIQNIETVTVASESAHIKQDLSLDNVDNTSDSNKPISTAVQSALDAKVDDSEKGSANGVATLDGSGKVPSSQLPVELMEFLGNWDASTNTPTLANTDTGKQGNAYRVSVAGTVDFGAGNITFGVGDWCFNNGSIWDKGDNTESVASVFGRSGVIVATSGDYTADQITETGTREFISPSNNTKLSFIAVTQAVDLDTMESDIATNNSKVTNATHTGDVSGSTTLTIGTKKVTVPMLADGTDGELITWSATGEATTVAVGTSGQVLTSNGPGAAPTFQAVGGGGGGLKTKSGSVSAGSFTGNPKKSTVTFSGAFADANYSPTAMCQGTDNYTISVESVAAGSFVINLNSNIAPSNNILWTAIKHGES